MNLFLILIFYANSAMEASQGNPEVDHVSRPLLDTTCPICLDPILNGEPFHSACGHEIHLFHETCIFSYFTKNVREMVCPLCKDPVSANILEQFNNSQHQQRRILLCRRVRRRVSDATYLTAASIIISVLDFYSLNNVSIGLTCLASFVGMCRLLSELYYWQFIGIDREDRDIDFLGALASSIPILMFMMWNIDCKSEGNACFLSRSEHKQNRSMLIFFLGLFSDLTLEEFVKFLRR